MKKLSAVLISALMVMVMAVTVFAAPAATQTAPAEAGSNIAPGTEAVNPQQVPVAQQQQQAAPVVPMTEESIEGMKVSSFATNDSDTSRPQDEGKIYVGYAITEGALDAANSNWTGNAANIALNNSVTGEGFTAVRASGEGSNVYISGKLELKDASDGQVASDFTGTGTAIVVSGGASAVAYDMDYYSEGFARSFAIVQDSSLVIQNSDILAMGKNPLKEAWDGYYNSANMSMMISPPWVLGIQGGIRAINVLGEGTSLVIADSTVTAGGWGVVSTDGCKNPYLYLYNSTLNILPESAGGMNSGWKILGYDADAYGSGYGSYIIGGAQEYFYGVTVNGATYASILTGGDAYYTGLEKSMNYEAKDAKLESLGSYMTNKAVNTTINTVFGFMAHNSGSINVLKGATVNTAESTFLYKDADVAWNVDGGTLNPGNGIILQMIDNDDKTVGGFDPFGTYLTEEAGFPTEGFAGEEGKKGNNVILSLAGGSYTGDVYNATGYYKQAADALTVTVAKNASLEGDIALASHVHGMWLHDRKVDDVVAAIEEANAYHAEIGGYYKDTEPMEYVLLDADGQVTEDKEKASAIQFTKFSTIEYYLLGHVLNMVYNNGLSTIDVNVEGTWRVASTSLVNTLQIAEGGHVFGEITELSDGTLLLVPAETELAAGTYGAAK